jgi:hypothetical protein
VQIHNIKELHSSRFYTIQYVCSTVTTGLQVHVDTCVISFVIVSKFALTNEVESPVCRDLDHGRHWVLDTSCQDMSVLALSLFAYGTNTTRQAARKEGRLFIYIYYC